jgi:hypothetical protein
VAGVLIDEGAIVDSLSEVYTIDSIRKLTDVGEGVARSWKLTTGDRGVSFGAYFAINGRQGVSPFFGPPNEQVFAQGVLSHWGDALHGTDPGSIGWDILVTSALACRIRLDEGRHPRSPQFVSAFKSEWSYFAGPLPYSPLLSSWSLTGPDGCLVSGFDVNWSSYSANSFEQFPAGIYELSIKLRTHYRSEENSGSDNFPDGARITQDLTAQFRLDQAVPEPAVIGLLAGAGVVCLVLMLSKRRGKLRA